MWHPFFAARRRMGLVTTMLVFSFLFAAAPGLQESAYAKDCSGTSVGFTPLNDLVGGFYNGEPGGLYPGNTNLRPNEAIARSVANGVGPVDATGKPAPDGRFGLISIGMSNTKLEFRRFVDVWSSDPDRNPELMVVNGAQGGMDAVEWSNPNSSTWIELRNRVTGKGLTPEQVQIAWVKLAIARPTAAGWTETTRLRSYLADVARILKDQYPNIKIAYYSSRIYAGYADKLLNPEPYAYESAFAVKWLIEDQIDGDPALNFDPSRGLVEAPLITWGPYLWADGLKARSDELVWTCGDLADDGTHPSDLGNDKVADILLDYFATDSTARPWFTGVGEEPGCTITGTEGADTITGTEGDDIICGLGGTDNIFGLGGNDVLNGGADNDMLDGGGGNDTLAGGDGDDLLFPGVGFDTVDGNVGTDTVGYPTASAAVTIDLAAGFALVGNASHALAGIENAIGGRSGDSITGDSGSNTLSGGGGNDSIQGLAGNDFLSGGSGDDHLDGGDGADICRGGTGTNILVNC